VLSASCAFSRRFKQGRKIAMEIETGTRRGPRETRSIKDIVNRAVGSELWTHIRIELDLDLQTSVTMAGVLVEPQELDSRNSKVGDKAKSQHEVFIFTQAAADDQITERNGRRYTVRLK
jgi:hypothetical protein